MLLGGAVHAVDAYVETSIIMWWNYHFGGRGSVFILFLCCSHSLLAGAFKLKGYHLNSTRLGQLSLNLDENSTFQNN